MVTNDIDMTSYHQMTDAERLASNLPLRVTILSQGTRTNFCHIFPPSTNWGRDPQGMAHPKVRALRFQSLVPFMDIDRLLILGMFGASSMGLVVSMFLRNLTAPISMVCTMD